MVDVQHSGSAVVRLKLAPHVKFRLKISRHEVLDVRIWAYPPPVRYFILYEPHERPLEKFVGEIVSKKRRKKEIFLFGIESKSRSFATIFDQTQEAQKVLYKELKEMWLNKLLVTRPSTKSPL